MSLFLKTLPEKIVYAVSMIACKIINGNKDLGEILFKKILCIKLDEIGDMCYSLHVFEMLKKQFPDSEITLLCRSYTVSLVKNDPNISKIVTDYSDLKNDYDLIIDLRGSMKSIFYSLKIMPKVRLDRGTVRYQNKKKGKHPHEVITNLQIVEKIISEHNKTDLPKIHIGQNEFSKADNFLKENNIKQFAVLHTGSRKKLRKWDKYIETANFLHQKKKLEIVFAGDESEKKEIKNIQSNIPFKTFSTAGIFDLLELAALISKAKIYIGNESGPLCIACICDTPSLGLFGPGEPEVFYPYGKKTTFIHHVLECNPCDQIHCVHPENPCIKRISFDEVVVKIEELLK